MPGNKTKARKNEGKVSPLKFALNLEVKSAAMYLRLAAETANPLGKKLFYSLAEEEIQHAMKVDEIYSSVKGSGDFRLLATHRSLPPIKNVMKGFFLKSTTRDLEKGNENISGYKIAIKLENESVNQICTSECTRKFIAENVITDGKPPGLCQPAFINKIKAVSELDPSENGGYQEDTERYGKGD